MHYVPRQKTILVCQASKKNTKPQYRNIQILCHPETITIYFDPAAASRRIKNFFRPNQNGTIFSVLKCKH